MDCDGLPLIAIDCDGLRWIIVDESSSFGLGVFSFRRALAASSALHAAMHALEPAFRRVFEAVRTAPAAAAAADPATGAVPGASAVASAGALASRAAQAAGVASGVTNPSGVTDPSGAAGYEFVKAEAVSFGDFARLAGGAGLLEASHGLGLGAPEVAGISPNLPQSPPIYPPPTSPHLGSPDMAGAFVASLPSHSAVALPFHR